MTARFATCATGTTTPSLLFVLSCLLPGPQFLIYIVLWIVVPAE